MTRARIVAVGARTPVGLDAVTTALGVRAAKLEPRPSPFKDARGRVIGTARCAGLDDALLGDERAVVLAAAALGEAARSARLEGPVPAFVALRSSANGGSDVLDRAARRAGVALDLGASETIAIGHVGFASALDRALKVLASTRSAAVLVGAVDTSHDPRALAELDADLRLHAPGIVNGVIPSEGAAFFALRPASGADEAWARLTSVCAGLEPEFDADGPALATTLTDLVRVACPSGPLGWVVTDENGERHRAKEWSFVKTRNPELFDPSATVEERPLTELGDAGAASGALLLAYVAGALKLGFAPASKALIALTGEGAERAAVAVEGAE